LAGIVNPGQTIRALEQIGLRAMEGVVPAFDSALTQALSAKAYQWPRKTVRSNGRTVSSPRDIIDTGELDSSQRLTRESRLVWRWDWNAAYALFVHEGVTFSNGTDMPARRWTVRAVEQFKPVAKFAKEVRKYV
jgi:hypothetical protein